MKANLITIAINVAGLVPLAKACGVTYQAIRKWEKAGYLPRTEWTGETSHAAAIEKATKRKVTKKELLSARKPAK